MKAMSILIYMVGLFKENGEAITHLKAQKMLFYIQAYHLAILDEPLFEEAIEAWEYGPVVPEIYQELKEYGSDPIDLKAQIDERIDSKSCQVVSSVVKAYGHLSALALVNKTHSEAPWVDAYNEKIKTIIQHDVMKEFYKKFLNG